MNINSLQGSAAYTNTLNAAPPVDNTKPEDQNTELDGTNPNKKETGASSKAFEVSITQEAQKKMATETIPADTTQAQTAPQPLENKQGQNMAQAYERSRIVNIVA
ncbi:hypothetical protein [Desulfobacula phenolica]|uniref:Uncharacterized protein n=1 Tax=Desulfobacula phenolica TaxID=90732 RepID=A0A1H2FCE0_9BACT|nr:hypothetical protein [Desulfobacula phenolica]SDU04933.1 hypothetical protein SAMN04487931_10477 [Desulfobacula phenolica]